jgi:dihydropteroate synthase
MTSFVNKTLRIKGRLIDLSRPKVMGILNVTPDSFYDGKRYSDLPAALIQVEKMITEGADFIDVGGYSSRPGAADISEEEELSRVVSVIKEIKKSFPESVVSIDTFRSHVAQRALDVGADLVNDISGGDLDPGMIDVVSRADVPYIVMHMRGTPQTMNQLSQYENLVKEIIESLHPKIHELTKKGVRDVIIDPGFGFAKSVELNFQLLNKLDRLKVLEKPILVGLSRKSIIWKTLETTPEDALNGTTALHAIALVKGASILRVHDVAEAKQCIELISKLGGGNG